MKRLFILPVMLLALSFSLTSCYKDVILPESVVDPDGPPQAVSFRADIEPMLNTQCALSGCHVSGDHKPYLVSGIAFTQIVNGGFVNTAVPKESILYKMIYGEMKEYIPSATDRQKIYDWIRNGAPNN
jgi:hypothetical protein